MRMERIDESGDYEVTATFVVNRFEVASHLEAVASVERWRAGYFAGLDASESGELGDILDIRIER